MTKVTAQCHHCRPWIEYVESILISRQCATIAGKDWWLSASYPHWKHESYSENFCCQSVISWSDTLRHRRFLDLACIQLVENKQREWTQNKTDVSIRSISIIHVLTMLIKQRSRKRKRKLWPSPWGIKTDKQFNIIDQLISPVTYTTVNLIKFSSPFFYHLIPKGYGHMDPH